MVEWWIWLVAGLIILIVELMSGTMFLLWIACGAFLAGIVALLVGGIWWVPWVVFTVTSVALIAATRPMVRAMQAAGGPQSNVDGLVGQEAVVLVSIDPVANTGRVRVGSDEWRARCSVAVSEGRRVLVEEVQGATLTVRPVEG